MNFNKPKTVAKQPVIRKTVVSVPVNQISRTSTPTPNGPVRAYDPDRFKLTQRRPTAPTAVPTKKPPPKPAQRALAASRGVKRKSATPQPAFSSDDDAEDDDTNGHSSDLLGSDSDVSRKRMKSSAASSVEPSGPRRSIISEEAFRTDDHAPDFMDGAAATSGEHAAKFKPPWDEEVVRYAELQYPSRSRPERFELKWPKNEADDYKPMEDIIETVKTVCEFYLPAELSEKSTNEETGFARRFNRAWQRQSLDDFLAVVADYNALIAAQLAAGTIQTTLRAPAPPHLPLDWTRRILDQIYARTVSPAVETLKAYQNGTDYVYGELLPRFISEILVRTGLRAGQTFVDLGSGVGNVALQAALEVGVESWGIERQDNPARLARRQAKEFPARVRLWGLAVGEVRLVQGDFTEHAGVLDVLKRADVVLVNNQAFTPALNDKLRDIFLDLKEGCQVASLKPFVPPGHKLTMRNYASVVNQFVQRKYEYFSNSVSWTDEGGDYYIAKVDRRPWHAFMERNGLR